MSERFQMPVERDCKFYQRRKHDKWREVPIPDPALEVPVADTHAHIHMLPDPAWELERCAKNGVDYVCMIVDPSEDGMQPVDSLPQWQAACAGHPTVSITAGVHPHNAKLYNAEAENQIVTLIHNKQIVAIGEIGLDYHYDLSPREVQRRVFRRQIALAKEADLPIVLHLRGGEDSYADNAHREAFEILKEDGFPEQGTLLHCCALPPDELQPWIEAGCYIAYGGTITFKNANAAREGARTVPADRLLLETDSPYMTPEPMRGTTCTPAHVIFTAAALAEVRGVQPGIERESLLRQIHANTLSFYKGM